MKFDRSGIGAPYRAASPAQSFFCWCGVAHGTLAHLAFMPDPLRLVLVRSETLARSRWVRTSARSMAHSPRQSGKPS